MMIIELFLPSRRRYMALQRQALLTLVITKHGYVIGVRREDTCTEERVQYLHPPNHERWRLLEEAQAMLAVLINGLHEQGYAVQIVDTITFYSLHPDIFSLAPVPSLK
jgi:hypothetical protein